MRERYKQLGHTAHRPRAVPGLGLEIHLFLRVGGAGNLAMEHDWLNLHWGAGGRRSISEFEIISILGQSLRGDVYEGEIEENFLQKEFANITE